jgi:O-acetylserine/cysteine efflux transporter
VAFIFLILLIGHGVVYYLLGRYPVSVTAPIMLLTPIIAIVFGVTIWGDVLTLKLVIGAITTISGVAIINWQRPRRKKWPRTESSSTA